MVALWARAFLSQPQKLSRTANSLSVVRRFGKKFPFYQRASRQTSLEIARLPVTVSRTPDHERMVRSLRVSWRVDVPVRDFFPSR